MSELARPIIQQVREQLARRRGEIRELHAGGALGSQVVAALTVMVDGVVSRLTGAAVDELSREDAAAFESGMAVVALGGYGRAELAPFSDVDVMFLYQPEVKRIAEHLCDRLVRDFWDVKLVLGSSLRSLAECTALARKDLSIHTSLLEARHVVGCTFLTQELLGQISRLATGRRADRFITAALTARAAEQAKSGSSVHLLEPDIKKSKGGLRELHLMRWIAHARYGMAGIDRLERAGLISPEDADTLRAAREFLFRIRNELHFFNDRAQDILTWDEQTRLAKICGYQDKPGMLAVEQFMQQYYRHSAALDELVDRFVRRCRHPSLVRRLLRPLNEQRIERDFRISGGEIAPTAQALPGVLASMNRTVYLFTLANRKRVNVADQVREQIRLAASKWNGGDLAAARGTFLAMLNEPGNLAQTLRHLHALGILEKLIPEFAHAHGLIQFNQYHKYTVDEHTLICVANAEKLLLDSSPLGQVYKDIHHKEILHLALLLHDLGKGFETDHSELGRQIAVETAERFALEPHLGELLIFLVHQHLLMAHLAFRRDTSDEKLLDRFARQVGTPEVLKMLFVLTAADIASVGPETWTSWKAEVLCDLYARMMEKLSGQAPTMHPEERTSDLRQQVARSLAGVVPQDWLDLRLAAMTPSYLLTNSVERIVEHFRTIRTLTPHDVVTTGEFDSHTKITTYTVYTFDDITPGLFSKVSGVLAAKGLQILSAQISTFTDGVVVDCFEVLDYDFDGEPPATRRIDVGTTIRQVLRDERSIESLFAKSTRIGPRYQPQPGTIREPTQVKIDNDTSDRFTIIEVFAHDRQGLLYVITKNIFELSLSVFVAKIATSLDQVLDVFYVTDFAGQKVTDAGRIDEIQRRLVEAIETFESNGLNAVSCGLARVISSD